MASIISIGFLLPDELLLARGWVILAWLLSFLFTAIGRFISRRFVYLLRKKGHFQTPALLVGANQEGKLLVEQFQGWPTSGIRLVGYVNDQPDTAMNKQLGWLGTLQDLDKIVEKYGVFDIVLTSSALTQEQVLALFRKFGISKDINLRMSSGLYEIITTGMQVTQEGQVPLLNINKVRMTGADMALKLHHGLCNCDPGYHCPPSRFPGRGAGNKFHSPGPIIYRRRVMGVNGKQFDAFKFRTMLVNSDDILSSHPEWLEEYQENYKLKNDPRVTRVVSS